MVKINLNAIKAQNKNIYIVTGVKNVLCYRSEH